MYVRSLCILLAVFLSGQFSQLPPAFGEVAGRRFVALPLEGGKVFISWRYKQSDGPEARYQIKRAEAPGGPYTSVAFLDNNSGTNFIDSTTSAGKTYYYYVTTPTGISETVQITASRTGSDCIVIPTRTDSSFQKLTVGDLDGDGRYEFIIRQPDGNKDPYYYRIDVNGGTVPEDGKVKGQICRQEPNPFKVEAYRLDGTLLWRRQLGPGVERGIWYAPMVVWDLDGDGRSEVILKDVEGNAINTLPDDGREWLVVIGPDGRDRTRQVWPDWLAAAIPGNEFSTYNLANRNMLGIACLDGQRPSVIVQRGTYSYCRTTAFSGADLTVLWDTGWRTLDPVKLAQRFEGEPFGRGAHGLGVADFDSDGRDEVLVGSTCVDDNGGILWGSLSQDQPDICIVGDIRPDLPGVETFLGLERYEYREDRPGLILADCAGRVVWSITGSAHVHDVGWGGLVSGRTEGWVLSAVENQKPRAWIVQADGRELFRDLAAWDQPYGLPLFWDGRLIRSLAADGKIIDWDTRKVLATYEGEPVCIADVLGDWREELITRDGNSIRVYTTILPTAVRRPSLMDDRQYALAVARSAAGYYIQPTESPAWWGRE